MPVNFYKDSPLYFENRSVGSFFSLLKIPQEHPAFGVHISSGRHARFPVRRDKQTRKRKSRQTVFPPFGGVFSCVGEEKPTEGGRTVCGKRENDRTEERGKPTEREEKDFFLFF